MCYEITIRDTNHQGGKEGKYIMTGEQGCGGKPSWKQASGLNVLYEYTEYLPDGVGMEDVWFIGPAYCSDITGEQIGIIREPSQ